MSKKLDDYIQEGIYGAKEIKKDEKKIYLGTFRERVVLALYTSQVRKATMPAHVTSIIKKYPNCHFLFNGEVGYDAFKKYIEIANKNKIHYRIVNNQEANSPYGLIVAVDTAVDVEQITIEEGEEEKTKKDNEKKRSGWFLL